MCTQVDFYSIGKEVVWMDEVIFICSVGAPKGAQELVLYVAVQQLPASREPNILVIGAVLTDRVIKMTLK